ncbi:hypothetical protein PSTG_05918 [Puccinia striiformis f. sp. tritici PST-78]|uniref:KN homeodomain domain-containing protein n=1 Tax=Puccinia striiformis f. sp. tritici PST-78 TaxID=1165861 RepID=A0A0L0VNB2_9BASI|nr:hypothetical protein PSTG_05918 [Puccinia striiformis f. sp. tritici PST-78]
MSDPLFSRKYLSTLERDSLAALKTNDNDALAKFSSQFSQHVLQLEEAIGANSISEDEARAHLCLSHNVYVASSAAYEAQLAVDEICGNFTQQLRLLTSQDNNPAQGTSVSPHVEPITENKDASPTSHTILKEWSQTHMAYLFPSPVQLKELASQTSTTVDKVNAWFRNARSRSGWAKLFAHQAYVDKDQQRFQLLIDEYNSQQRINTPEKFKTIVSENESYQLLEKIFRWFATTKPVKQAPPSSSVRPWIKDVLSSTLASFRTGAAGILGSSKQLLPSFSPRSDGSSSSSTCASSPSASTPPTSVAGSSSSRSDSLDSSSRRSTPSRSSLSPFFSPAVLPSQLTYSACNERSAATMYSPSTHPSPSCSSLSPVIPSSHISPELLALSNPACSPLGYSSSGSTQSRSSLSPALSPFNLPSASSSSFTSNSQSAEPLDSSSPRTTPSTSSLSSAVSPFTIAPELVSTFPNTIGTDQWNNPFNFSSGDSSSSSSGSLSPVLSPSNVSTDPTSSPGSNPYSPDCQYSPTSYSPCLPRGLQPAGLEPSFALSSSLKLFLSKNQPAILGSGSSSPTDSSRSRPSTASTESILSGQFDDAPEDE